jgi:hypothetical protein
MHKNHIRIAIFAGLVMLVVPPGSVSAQTPFVGAGIGVSSIPRSRAPLCGAARRLTGPSASGVVGIRTANVRIAAVLEATQTPVHEVASCVPLPPGLSVDSSFAEANTSAWTAGLEVSKLLAPPVHATLGAGIVPNHKSWFVSGGIGAQYRRLRLETAARWHQTSFDEVTRDVTEQGAREVDRVQKAEMSWGGSIRLVFVTR